MKQTDELSRSIYYSNNNKIANQPSLSIYKSNNKKIANELS